MNNLLLKKTNELTKKKKKGFTLIELIIVIAIIAILAAIALPKFGQIRNDANIKADIASAKAIQTAVLTALANGDISLPASNTTLGATADAANDDLTDVLEGGTVPTPKATSGTFSAVISPTGEVTVSANGIQILPSPAGIYS